MKIYLLEMIWLYVKNLFLVVKGEIDFVVSVPRQSMSPSFLKIMFTNFNRDPMELFNFRNLSTLSHSEGNKEVQKCEEVQNLRCVESSMRMPSPLISISKVMWYFPHTMYLRELYGWIIKSHSLTLSLERSIMMGHHIN